MKKQSFLAGVCVTALIVAIVVPRVIHPSVITQEKVSFINTPVYVERIDFREEASSLKSTLNQSKLKHILIYIHALCEEYNVDYDMVKAVITTESNWRHNAVSSSGAIGLMQILPRTGMSVFNTPEKELYDPYVNVTVGIMYLSNLNETYDSDLYAVLTAYSHGPTAMKKYSLQYITQNNYVDRVIAEM